MRVTHNMTSIRMLRNINRNGFELSELQEKMASGKAVLRPSDDALEANAAIRFDRVIQRNTQYEENIELGTSMVNIADTTLGELHTQMQRAKALALQELDSGADPDTRDASALEVESILQQVVSIANRQFREKYLFGGTNTDEVPFFQDTNGVRYRGNDTEFSIEVSEEDLIEVNVTGAQVFGALDTKIDNDVDIDPTLTWDTKLADLNNGQGVVDGSISIILEDMDLGLGLPAGAATSSSITVDLSNADTLRDVKDIIEAATVDITGNGFDLEVDIDAAGTGIEITSLGVPQRSFSISEVANNTVADELGILKNAYDTTTTTAADLEVDLTLDTAFTSINGGTGLTSPGGYAGFTVTNGSKTYTFTADEMAGWDTLQDMKNEIERLDLDVRVEIDSSNDSLEIISDVSGSALSITENGGTTATELGILSLTTASLLRDFNGGKGWDEGSFIMNLQDGSTYTIDLAGSETISDVVSSINTQSGGDVTAALDTINGVFTLTDNTVGANPFEILETVGLPTAATLGLDTTAVGNLITGGSVDHALRGENIFTALMDIRDGMLTSDIRQIELAAQDLDDALTTLLSARAELGARGVRMESTHNRVSDERITTTELFSEVVDLNYADAVLEFQNLSNTFEAGMRAAGQITQLSLLDFV